MLNKKQLTNRMPLTISYTFIQILNKLGLINLNYINMNDLINTYYLK